VVSCSPRSVRTDTRFSRPRRGGEEDYLLGIDPLFPSRLAHILVASTILQYPVALLILN
jgi:hypothetical protein